MDTTNVLLIALLFVMIYLVLMLSQKKTQNSVVYFRGPRVNYLGGQGPLWFGPRPGRFRPRFRRRFWW
tara:strand:+ start:845 stop:1048 length:204 start_codon:yes stop_codon:yes gene_type:complete